MILILNSSRRVNKSSAGSRTCGKYELIGKHYKIVAGKYVETGLVCPGAFGITNGNPHLLSFVREAIEKHRLDRSLVTTLFHGEGTRYARAGIPTVERIAQNAPQFTNDDTPETVMVEHLGRTTAAFIDIIRQIDATPADALKEAGSASARAGGMGERR